MSEFPTEENNYLERTKNDKQTQVWKQTTYDVGKLTKEEMMRDDKMLCSQRL